MATLDVARDENLTIKPKTVDKNFRKMHSSQVKSCKPKAKVNFVFDADHPIVSACVTPQ